MANSPNGSDDSTIVKKEYTDGFGRMLQSRSQAETIVFGSSTFGDSGLPSAIGTNADAVGIENASSTPNVVVSGWKSYNNKGEVFEQWEPYFDTNWDFDAPNSAQTGAKMVQFYDPLGRVNRTLNADGTEQRVLFGKPSNLSTLAPSPFVPTPWESYTYDANDLAEITHTGQAHNVPSSHLLTPRSVTIDALGRTIETVDRNHDGTNIETVVMRFAFDIRGNNLFVDDAIKNAIPASTRPSAFVHVYDFANQPLKTTHIEKGISTVAINAAGIPIEMRDAKGAMVVNAFDELLRPTNIWARDNDNEDVTLRQHLIYGESLGTPEPTNHRGQVYKHYDEAGLLFFGEYDYKGNLNWKTRRVIKDSEILDVFDPAPSNWEVPTYRVNWTGLNESGLLETDAYQTDYEYDALNRATKVTLPQDVASQRKVVTPVFNRAGALEAIKLDNTDYVSHIAYNAKGQRLLVAYGNGVMTRYAYDDQNFRLLRQKSESFSLTTALGTHTYAPSSGTTRQDNQYKYDLAGNIVWMQDGRGDSAAGGIGMLQRNFEYDPLYRLLHDTGRESTNYSNYADPHQDPNVSNGVANTRTYNRYYTYDRLGNMLKMEHNASGNSFNRWFNDADTSLSLAYRDSNLATKIKYGGNVVTYSFDANGNQVSEGSSRHFEWDFADQLRAYATQTGTSEPTVFGHYLYGADGNRVKKVVRKSAGNHEVSIYIDGGFEYLYETNGSSKVQEMNEIHIMDGRSRIARIREHITSTWSGPAPIAVLYNLEDHLGNASFTLTATGGHFSQEEYFPFGETSFGSFAKKRYRFCGKERDEESGLYYYGARYYAPWMCRFVSVDPLAAKYPFYTPYQYAGNKPINFIDLDGLEPTYPLKLREFKAAYQNKNAKKISEQDSERFGKKPNGSASGFGTASALHSYYRDQAWIRASRNPDHDGPGPFRPSKTWCDEGLDFKGGSVLTIVCRLQLGATASSREIMNFAPMKMNLLSE